MLLSYHHESEFDSYFYRTGFGRGGTRECQVRGTSVGHFFTVTRTPSEIPDPPFESRTST